MYVTPNFKCVRSLVTELPDLGYIIIFVVCEEHQCGSNPPSQGQSKCFNDTCVVMHIDIIMIIIIISFALFLSRGWSK